MKDRRGFALVLTLIVTAILVAVVTEFVRQVYIDTTLRRAYLNAQQASLLADSGVEAGKAIITATRQLTQIRGSFSSFYDGWSGTHPIPADEGKLIVTIEEENAKLDLNSIALPSGFHPLFGKIAARLFENLGLQPARTEPGGPLLDALGDWFDENNEPRLEGTESNYYLAQRVPYTARNARFQSVDELNLVRGFTPDVMRRFRPFVTATAGSPTPLLININTAPDVVLAALPGMTAQLAKDVIKYRQEHEPFSSIGELGKAGVPSAVTSALAGAGTVKGTIYRITAKATAGEAIRTIEAIVDMNDLNNPKTLYWREY